ncbi:MAG: dihydrodipicolinate reductase [Chloroflexi bacterium]|nr:dihydrodipicolinate reductase [Chloroflexota bacterium]
MIRVVHYGLGPIGVGVARLIASRKDMQIVGAIDIDPQKVGRDFAELLGRSEPLGVSISGDAQRVLTTSGAQIVVLTTSSSLKRITGQIRQIVECGSSVISTCEELSYPPAGNADRVADLDALAKKHGVAIYGTGVNPGYVMDALPLMLTVPCAEVKRIRVERVVDAGKRRLPLQQKVGAGMTRPQFQQKVDDGSVRHVGLRESATMIANSLGWTLSQYTEQIEPVMAEREVVTPYLTVKPGEVAGVHQIGTGFVDGQALVTLDIAMYVGAQEAHDTIWIEGTPNVQTTIIGGLHGDVATAAIVVNSIPRILSAPPGLWTPNDLPIPHWRRP